MKTTYEIPSHNLGLLEEAVTKLNKRALKLGMNLITMTVDKVHYIEVGGQHYEMCTTTIEGEAPVLEGYTFAGELTHEHGATTIRTAGGEHIPQELQDAAPKCDHCGYKRHRKHTFVLRQEDGGYRQVGKNCLRDFFGGVGDPHKAANMAKVLVELDSLAAKASEPTGMGASPSDGRAWELLEVAAYADWDIRHKGYMTKTRYRQELAAGRSPRQATAHRVLTNIDRKNAERDPAERARLTPHAGCYRKAADAIAWAKTLPGDSDFQRNVREVAEAGYVGVKHFALGVAMMAAFNRHLAGQQVASEKKSGYLGAVGERRSYKLQCLAVIPTESYYGPGSLVRFADEEGNVAVWFTKPRPSMRTMTDYFVRGTVKRHGEYKGTPQTVLTRCDCTPI